jgi:hypothetical protein
VLDEFPGARSRLKGEGIRHHVGQEKDGLAASRERKQKHKGDGELWGNRISADERAAIQNTPQRTAKVARRNAQTRRNTFADTKGVRY